MVGERLARLVGSRRASLISLMLRMVSEISECVLVLPLGFRSSAPRESREWNVGCGSLTGPWLLLLQFWLIFAWVLEDTPFDFVSSLGGCAPCRATVFKWGVDVCVPLPPGGAARNETPEYRGILRKAKPYFKATFLSVTSCPPPM